MALRPAAAVLLLASLLGVSCAARTAGSAQHHGITVVEHRVLVGLQHDVQIDPPPSEVRPQLSRREVVHDAERMASPNGQIVRVQVLFGTVTTLGSHRLPGHRPEVDHVPGYVIRFNGMCPIDIGSEPMPSLFRFTARDVWNVIVDSLGRALQGGN
jgi:hypothetical protein